MKNAWIWSCILPYTVFVCLYMEIICPSIEGWTSVTIHNIHFRFQKHKKKDQKSTGIWSSFLTKTQALVFKPLKLILNMRPLFSNWLLSKQLLVITSGRVSYHHFNREFEINLLLWKSATVVYRLPQAKREQVKFFCDGILNFFQNTINSSTICFP